MKEKTKIIRHIIDTTPTEVDTVDAFMMCSSMQQTIYGADTIVDCNRESGFPIPTSEIMGHVFKYYVSPHISTEIAVAYYDMFDDQPVQ